MNKVIAWLCAHPVLAVISILIIIAMILLYRFFGHLIFPEDKEEDKDEDKDDACQKIEATKKCE